MIPSKLKPIINKLIIFSFKNHWLMLLILTGFMYLSGKVMAEPNELFFTLPANLFRPIRQLHGLMGKLIFISAIALTFEKLYLIVSRRLHKSN